MVQIKKFELRRNTLSPIGIVRPAQDPTADALQNAGANLMTQMFRIAVTEESQKGRELARDLIVRDENGQIKSTKLPQDLSLVATRAAQPIIDNKYENAFKLDLASQAKQYHAENKFNPEGFSAAFSSYYNKVSQLNPRYKPYIDTLGTMLGKEHTAAIFSDKLKRDRDIAYKNSYASLLKSFDDFNSMLAQGINPYDQDGITYDNLLQSIIDHKNLYGDKMSKEEFPALVQKLNQITLGGVVSVELNKVNQYVTAKAQTNPTLIPNVGNEAKKIINDIALKVQSSAHTLSPQTEAFLKESGGFVKLFENTRGILGSRLGGRFSQQVREKVAADIRTYEGTITESFNANKNLFVVNALRNQIEKNMAVAPNDMTTYLKTIGIESSTQMAQIFPNLYNQDPVFKQYIDMNMGKLPPVITDAFSRENITALAVSGKIDLNTAQDIVESMTTRIFQGKNITVSRGFEPEVLDFYNALKFNIDGISVKGAETYLADLNKYYNTTDADRKSVIKGVLDKRDFKNVQDFIDSLSQDIDTERVDFVNLMSRIPELLFIYNDSKVVENIIKATDEAFYSRHELMFDKNTRYRFSPNLFYTQEEIAGMKMNGDLLLKSLLNKGHLDKEYVIGKNASLVPDYTSNPNLPSYVVVNENGLAILDKNLKPTKIGGLQILRDRKQKAKIIEERNRQRLRTARESLSVTKATANLAPENRATGLGYQNKEERDKLLKESK
tara:strand:- start:2116 stop:4293 length:2178 start_codon:yes stop_codon:yes gene_type:complete